MSLFFGGDLLVKCIRRELGSNRYKLLFLISFLNENVLLLLPISPECVVNQTATDNTDTQSVWNGKVLQ